MQKRFKDMTDEELRWIVNNAPNYQIGFHEKMPAPNLTASENARHAREELMNRQ